jgi:cell division transport system permease protein
MTFAAVTNIAVALFLLGGFVYVLLSVNRFSETIPGKFDMRVFLKEGTTRAQITETAAQIRAIPGVKGANWIPREKAWERYGKEYPELTRGIENPFPDAFKVTIRQLEDGETVAAALRKLATVDPEDGVQYLRETIDLLDQATQFTRWLGTVLGGLLLLTGGILIYNTTRLSLMARQKEIRVMQLVGASPLMIRVPLYLEGVVHGLLGGAVAAGLLFAAQNVLERRLTTLDVGAKLTPFPVVPALGVLALAGAGIGLFCSVAAVRTPVRSA